MKDIVDARGMACPQPVMRTRAAMAEGGDVIVTIVDNEVAAQNVARMAEKAGRAVRVERRGDGIYLELTEAAGDCLSAAKAVTQPGAPAGPTVWLVKSDRMGIGDDDLGAILMRGLFHTLLELEELPATIIFVNSGVKLAVAGSPVLEDVQALAARGVEILACGTCLSYYNLADRLEAGAVSNMYSIVEALAAAGKIVSP